jgi:high-affinity Fe2+/Pb2+ permease
MTERQKETWSGVLLLALLLGLMLGAWLMLRLSR